MKNSIFLQILLMSFFTAIKDDIEKILGISDFSRKHLPDKLIEPRITRAYKNYHQKKDKLIVITCY